LESNLQIFGLNFNVAFSDKSHNLIFHGVLASLFTGDITNVIIKVCKFIFFYFEFKILKY